MANVSPVDEATRAVRRQVPGSYVEGADYRIEVSRVAPDDPTHNLMVVRAVHKRTHEVIAEEQFRAIIGDTGKVLTPPGKVGRSPLDQTTPPPNKDNSQTYQEDDIPLPEMVD